MRRNIALVIALIVAAGAGTLTYVKAKSPAKQVVDTSGGMNGMNGMNGNLMGDSSGLMGGKSGLGGTLGLGLLMPGQMATVEDGIVLVVGDKLVKYDANLNKTSEKIIEIDSMSMQRTIRNMRRMQSMYTSTTTDVSANVPAKKRK